MGKILITDCLLSGKIRGKIDAIASSLEKSRSTSLDLMGGKAGEALFWAYYSKLTKNEEHKEKAINLILEVFDRINEGFAYPTFAGGLAGIGWLLQHMVHNEFLDADIEEITDTFDGFMNTHMIHFIKNGNYDFLHGALGIGLYYLNQPQRDKNRGFITGLINELEKNSLKRKEGLLWEIRLAKDRDVFGCNLSLSHGIASIIVILSRFFEAGICNERIAELVNGAATFLLSSQCENSKDYIFPSWVCNTELSVGGRLAWCYNDLGIGIALWQAGSIFKNEEWKKKAVDIVMNTTMLKHADITKVVDAGLCHGASGVAHIYNRMYNYTKIIDFKHSAIFWFEQCLKMSTYNDGLAGYKSYFPPEYGGWQNSYGLLEGVSGVGLSLIAAISDIEPVWDRVLLLS